MNMTKVLLVLFLTFVLLYMIDISGRVHRIVSEHACELPVTSARREGFVTSDDGTNSTPYILEEGKIQDGDTYMYVCHPKDILTTSQSYPSGIHAPTRVMSFNQKVMCNHENRERESKAYEISKTFRWINHEQDCKDDQFVPSCLLTNIQMHKIASTRTQDKATQTAGFSSLTSQDASVQCCLLKAAEMSMFTKPTTHVHHSRTHKAPASRRQTCHRSENPDHNKFTLTKIPKKWNSSWIMTKREPTKQSPKTIKGHESLSNSESQTCVKKQPLLHFSHTRASELKEQPSKNMVFRGERCEGHEEASVNQNPTVNSSCTEEHNNAFTAETGGDRVSEGNGNLKEIADILLMMKQKNKYP